MTPETVLNLGQQTIETAALVSAPLLLTALVVGVVIGLFQAASQINEMTLSFVPKLLAMALMFILTGAWMLTVIVDFTRRLFTQIPQLIG